MEELVPSLLLALLTSASGVEAWEQFAAEIEPLWDSSVLESLTLRGFSSPEAVSEASEALSFDLHGFLSSIVRHSGGVLVSLLPLLTIDLSSCREVVASGLLQVSFDLLAFDLSSVAVDSAKPSLALLVLGLSSPQPSLDLHGFGLVSSVAASGASETTEVQLSFGRQGFDFSSAWPLEVSSDEKQGKHVVPVDFGAQDLMDEMLEQGGGPGVFEGGTLPNMFAVIALGSSRLNGDGGSPPPPRPASHTSYEYQSVSRGSNERGRRRPVRKTSKATSYVLRAVARHRWITFNRYDNGARDRVCQWDHDPESLSTTARVLEGDAVRQAGVDEREHHMEHPQRRNLAHLS